MKSLIPSSRALSTDTVPSLSPGTTHRPSREAARPGDDTELVVRRRQTPGQACGVGSELGRGGPEHPAEGGGVAEAVDPLAPAVGRGQHHDPPELEGLVGGEVGPDQDAAEGVGDEVQAAHIPAADQTREPAEPPHG
jgi:hypothetical protein